MKAYEIEGWLDGTKIRRQYWMNQDFFIYYCDKNWYNSKGKKITEINELFHANDWIKYTGASNKITMHRYTFKDEKQEIRQSEWTTEEFDLTPYCTYKLLKTEEKEVDLNV